ncbi:MAG: DNA methyltransferase [Patescibacteria group bacterium]|nr:MAG: DNA methyltransferase [Patescibacteria group bacterium]
MAKAFDDFKFFENEHATFLDLGDYASDVDNEIIKGFKMSKRLRPLFTWYGSKTLVAKWIVSFFPTRGVARYIEPFCGSAVIFLHLPVKYPVEVLNDINGSLITFFRCLQDRQVFNELCHRLIWTMYSRAEYLKAMEILKNADKHNQVDVAWAFYTSHCFSFLGKIQVPGGWSRAITSVIKGAAENCVKWQYRRKMLVELHKRFSFVQFDNRDAIEVIKYWDRPDSLFYLDPPYVLSSRRDKKPAYQFEFSEDQHRQLVETLLAVRGKVVLSGYENEIYKQLEDNGWHKFKRAAPLTAARKTTVSSKAKKIETLWLNFVPFK